MSTSESLADAVARSPAIIEYRRHDGRLVPFSVALGNGRTFDFDWCRRDRRAYFSQSGSGRLDVATLSPFYDREAWTTDEQRMPIWIAESLPVRDAAGRAVDLAEFGYVRLDAPVGDPFAGTTEAMTHYCRVCDDRLPEDDAAECVCEHVWWCSTEWNWVGTEDGAEAACQSEDCDNCRKATERA